MRVIIADDHPVVRIGLRMLVDLNRTCVVVGEADGPDSLLSLLCTTPCDLLITDFCMPGNLQADGLKMLSRVRRGYPAMPIILVTMFANVTTLRAAFAQGVVAIIAKGASAKELPMAIDPCRRAPLHQRVVAHGAASGRRAGPVELRCTVGKRTRSGQNARQWNDRQ